MRWLLRILLLLILGAVTTACMAWSLGTGRATDTFAVYDTSAPFAFPNQSPTWMVTSWSSSGVLQIFSERLLEPDSSVSSDWPPPLDWRPPNWSRVNHDDPPPPHEYLLVEAARGWPMLALRMDFTYRFSSANGWQIDGARGGIDLTGLEIDDLDWMGRRGIPLRPIFPGFIIDTLFYALVWFALLSGFTRGRRMLRARARLSNGLCPNCGYDLQGKVESGCPECGWGRSLP